MARADLLLKLVQAGSRGEQALFRKTVEALAAEERAKKHTILADRLLAQMQPNGYRVDRSASSPTTRAGPLVTEVIPARELKDMVLPAEAEATVRELVDEQLRADLLRSYNLEPRNRVLLVGPPGNGKTTLAEALADALHVPLLVVRYEGVIGSFLGETAQRIGQVFEDARSRHCVLFFDEFDVVGKERGDIHETGEIKRVVSSLLLQVDHLPSYVVVVTASNHPELLDRAVLASFPDSHRVANAEAGTDRRVVWAFRAANRTLIGPFGSQSRTEVARSQLCRSRRVRNRRAAKNRIGTAWCRLQSDRRATTTPLEETLYNQSVPR